MSLGRLAVGLLALVIGVGFLLLAPGMVGASCLVGEVTSTCRTDPGATARLLFVVAAGVLSASVGGWNVVSVAR